MMPTRLQDRALIAKIIGVPIPPAPTIPRIDAERTANSKRYKVNDKTLESTAVKSQILKPPSDFRQHSQQIQKVPDPYFRSLHYITWPTYLWNGH